MKSPKYITDMFAFVLFHLGVMFLLFGGLTAFGFMGATESSLIQDRESLALTFAVLGSGMLSLIAVVDYYSCKWESLHNELLESGRKITANVDSVKRLSMLKLNRKSPYRVYCTFTHDGVTCQGKSQLIWQKPTLQVGDSVNVYVNDKGQSAVELP